MLLIKAFTLALLQGITEFLPISSSAHLILLPKLLNWQDQGLAFDIAVHCGTLIAVILYLRRDLKQLCLGIFDSLVNRKMTPDGKLAWSLALATIPVGVLGILLHDLVAQAFRSVLIIALATIIFGLLLWLAEVRNKNSKRDMQTITWLEVVFIGAMQALALIPGSSRSGLTLTAGLFTGLSREAAARYSFLLAIPVILAAGLLQSLKLIQASSKVDWGVLGFASLVAALSAYCCIAVFLRCLNRIGTKPFVVYRIFLGIGLLFFALSSKL